MKPKPDACKGCPLYQSGCGFVPDELQENADVMIIGQNPGAEEEAQGRPFVGKTGQGMEKKFLPLAGLTRSDVSIGNALRCRWQNSNELPPLEKPDTRAALNHCRREHLRIPSGTKLIVAQGAYAMHTLTGEGLTAGNRITDWRGWLLPLREELHAVSGASIADLGSIFHPHAHVPPVLVTLHLASLYHTPEMRVPTQMDWSKVSRILAGRWPERLPPIDVVPPALWPKEAAFDTEFPWGGGELTRYSLFTPDGRLYVVEAADAYGKVVVPRDAMVVMHNAEADMLSLHTILGQEPRVEDTMLAHATLWPGMPHDLGFLASMYGRLNRSKHLMQLSPIVYSGADAVITWDAWLAMLNEFGRDPQSEWIYRNCMAPLVPIIMEATSVGLRLDKERVKQATEALYHVADEETLKARAAVGWPISLASPAQVAHWLYTIENIRPKKRGKG